MAVLEIKVPTIAESITEVTLSQWLKANGSMVKIDEPICEFESDKATLELPAEVAGKLIWVAKEGDDLKIGAVVAKIDTEAAGASPTVAAPVTASVADAPKAEVKTEPAAPVAAKQNYATGTPSPAAAKIMAENGLPASDVAASGRDGRITKDDAQKAAETKSATPVAPVAPAKTEEAPKMEVAKTPVAIVAPANFSRNEHRNKMSRMRRTIAKRLVSAKNNTAMLTTFNEVDLTELMGLREKYQDKFVKKYKGSHPIMTAH